MSAKPWMNSDDLIASVKRKILFPVSQNTFTENDILAFANEEMFVSQVPTIMQFHQEYFVSLLTVPLVANQKAYPIPDRAIGMKLRDVFLADANGNLYEMTRIQSEDRTFFQSGNGTVNTIYTYYLQGNDLVLTSNLTPVPPSNLVFAFWMRPNQLVSTDRAATIQSFQKTVTLNTVNPGDLITISSNLNGTTTITDFQAVASGATGNQFNIGGTTIITATNLVNAINNSGVATATNVNNSSNVATIIYNNVDTSITTSNSAEILIQGTLTMNCDQVNPAVFTNGALIDFLQTKPGHKTRAYDIQLPQNAISGNSLTFVSATVPEDLVVGDYICLANECIIPQIPPDLHTGLAERTAARILAAIGDQAGLQVSQAKIQDIDQRQGNLLDNRSEGSPIKVTARHSLLSYGKMNYRRLL